MAPVTSTSKEHLQLASGRGSVLLQDPTSARSWHRVKKPARVPGMVVHICNLSTEEVTAGRSRWGGQSGAT